MFCNFLCKRLGFLPKRRLRCMAGDLMPQLSGIRFFSSSKQQSFTVNYLISSCGLSPMTADSISQRIQLEDSENSDSVLALLRSHGCTNAEISRIISRRPKLLLANPEKTLLPKLEFFHSIGLSGVKLTRALSTSPDILCRSLNNHLIPHYNFLKNVVVGDENIVKSFTKIHWFSFECLQNSVAPNLEAVKEIGVPISYISILVRCYPGAVCIGCEEFSRSLKRVLEMGFDPLRLTFVNALRVICLTSESAWKHKMDIYRRWGWNDDEIMLLFRYHPLCMTLSEKKVMSTMDFLVNEMGWQPGDIARVPVVLFFNLKERIVPRCSVVKVLLLKGLVKKSLTLGTFLKTNERKFLDKYVIEYKETIPQLLNLYQRKISLQELGFESEDICGRKTL